MPTKTSTPGSAAGRTRSSTTEKDDVTWSGVSLELRNFLADIEDLIKQTTSLTGDELAAARAQLDERVAAVKESVEEMGGATVERARRTAADANEYVHEQPWQAIGVGAAVGLLLGLLLARRS